MKTILIKYNELIGLDFKWSISKLDALWNDVYNELPEDIQNIFNDVMKYQDVPYEFDIHPGIEVDDSKRVIPYRFKFRGHLNTNISDLVESHLNKFVILTDWD